jgi:hypothetical protein
MGNDVQISSWDCRVRVDHGTIADEESAWWPFSDERVKADQMVAAGIDDYLFVWIGNQLCRCSFDGCNGQSVDCCGAMNPIKGGVQVMIAATVASRP